MREHGRCWRGAAAGVLGLAIACGARAATPPLPIIDMHVHTGSLDLREPVLVCPGNAPLTYPAIDPRSADPKSALVECDRPIPSAMSSGELMERTIGELRRHNVRRAILAGSPQAVAEWSAQVPGLFVPATFPSNYSPDALAALGRLHEEGRAAVFAEIGAQYDGLRADDPRLEPFWALAEELDVPVGIHLGEGMPGQAGPVGQDRYRAADSSPFQLEEVLQKHPRLRLYVMHAASPLTDEMIAMLFEYPTLHVDISANNWNMPRAQFYDQLKRLVDAGFSKRILFGSDQTVWPQGIGLAIETVNEAPFLTAQQKRDIFYNNAARFLRLTKAQIAEDHAPPAN